MKYDVIIVGGASAGLTAAIYSARRALKTLVLTKDIGGQASITTEIENYPGYEKIKGPELMMKFYLQAQKSGATINLEEVIKIEKLQDGFKVITKQNEYESQSVILAFGLQQRKLQVEGEEKLTGRGVAYCATCDGPLFKNKVVGVVGGGNSALDAAEYLSQLAQKVYLIVRTEKFRAEQILIDAVQQAKNIEILTNTQVKKCLGENRLEQVVLFDTVKNQETSLTLDGLFVEIGWLAKTQMLVDLVKLDEKGFVVVDREQKTSTAGIFACGDICSNQFKQVIISAGEGAIASLATAKYLQKKGQLKKISQDWNRREGSLLDK